MAKVPNSIPIQDMPPKGGYPKVKVTQSKITELNLLNENKY